MVEQPKSALVILRLKQVIAQTGKSRVGIYDAMNSRHKNFDPYFPKPIKLGPASKSSPGSYSGAVGWLEHEVQDWISLRIGASRNQSNEGSGK